ncbi:MAG: group III truncated hemoglobin [Lentisphaeraceae bacterium]|nr:group III truncated hemoglobin [Lentisphaeraceae bacterium]
MSKEVNELLKSFLEKFYECVREDELLKDTFNGAISNWDKHIRKIEIFWRSHLYDPGLYKGNPLEVHKRLHSSSQFTEEQFVRWLEIFEKIAKDFYEGKELTNLKRKARMIGGTLYGRLLDKELEVPGFNAFDV